jgi:aryl-alcohol dehydrogenase-like predicted oxidoreductase
LYASVKTGETFLTEGLPIEQVAERVGLSIHLYYAHIDDWGSSLEETLEAFDGLIRSGKVRYVGCSNTTAWRFEKARNVSRANGFAEYRCVQQRRTYLRPKPSVCGLLTTSGRKRRAVGLLRDPRRLHVAGLLAAPRRGVR